MRRYEGYFYTVLKNAVRRAREQAGPRNICAEHTRVGGSQLARYEDHNEPDYFAPLDVAADLDALAGDDIILRTWAGLRGFELVPRERLEKVDCFHLHLCGTGKEAGELLARLGEALKDGRISPREAREILKEADDLESRLVALKKDCAAKIPGGAS